MRVRPSGLQIAEVCIRAPYLAHRYKEHTPAAEKGNAVDAEVSIELTGGEAASGRHAQELIAWARKRFPPDAQLYVQRKVTLIDPNTLEVLTEGTPDLLVVTGSMTLGRKLYVVDWKSKGQLYAGYIAQPDDNLQQLAYMVAAGMECGADEGQIILACFDDKGVTPIDSRAFGIDEWEPIIDRIKAIPPFDPEGKEPEANKGDHCARCYQRMHCSAYLLPAIKKVPVELRPFVEGGGGLTTERAIEGLEWLDLADEAISKAKKVRDLVAGQIMAFANTHGPIRQGDREWGPVHTAGKRGGPTVKELEELGLTNLIKPGKPGVKYDWRKVKAGDEGDGGTPA